ncbi:molybdopterin-binding protein [Methylocucumis oryzae]|uniref:molybdopterin-binding protein n=1 Tax=Methylocucumis oryzae TaxID=1632867 RepID=UPI001EF9E91A|nr:molybdopterin-binding protein [Methylocucumis oryzae]
MVTGQTVDTNAAWLAQQGVQLGFQVARHSTVGDKLDDLISLMQTIAERADCCFCTGGLGPTSDDLTALAVAKAFDLELIFDEEAYHQNAKRFLP